MCQTSSRPTARELPDAEQDQRSMLPPWGLVSARSGKRAVARKGDRMASEPRRTVLTSPGEGKSFWLAGDLVTFKATGADTLGAFLLVEATSPPQGGPPPHRHSREDEAFYILEGTFEFLAGDQTITATAGSFVSGPKGITHTFKNVGTTPGKFLLIVSPPEGFESFVKAAALPATDPSSPPPPPGPQELEQLVALAGQYGIEIFGPPPRG
jgi:quercetin dioxygenase-like cupin family protein